MSLSNAQILEYVGTNREKEISAVEQGRIQATKELIPHEVKSILDVGCGDGRVTGGFQNTQRKVFGVDYAFSSVKSLGQSGVCASSAKLPFPDNSFDMVLCCEVLEHLPEELMVATAQEMERIARKYILVSVPYKENLRRRLTKCQKCHTVFHAWGHLRSISEEGLDSLFSSCISEQTKFYGKRPPYYNSLILYYYQIYGDRWGEFHETSICPQCGNTQYIPTRVPRNLYSVVCGGINLVLSKIIPVPSKNWILKLYSVRS